MIYREYESFQLKFSRGEPPEHPFNIMYVTVFLYYGEIQEIYHSNTNKSPKGHWSLTWVQWALLLYARNILMQVQDHDHFIPNTSIKQFCSKG